MATSFVQQGAKVVATDIQAEKLNELVDRIKSNGGKAISILHNVTDRNTWFEKIIPQTITTFGMINILVNNIGNFNKEYSL